MDAIEFVKQLRRMNEKGVLKNRYIYPCVGGETDSPEDVVAEVDEWAKMNPIKTRQSVFLEQWPEAYVSEGDVLQVCPRLVSASHRKNAYVGCAILSSCTDCKKEFWMQGVE